MLGNYEDAMKLYQKCVQKDPENHAAMYELAGLLDFAGETGAAITLTKEAIKRKDDNIWYRRQLGGMLSKVGRFDEAVKEYEQIAKMEPGNVDNYLDWAKALLYDNQLNEAIQVYNKVEDRTGKDFRLTMEKHHIYTTLGKHQEAVKVLEEYLEEVPDDVVALGILAESYQKMGLDDKAFELFKRALQIAPDDGILHLSLANYYKEKGEIALAQESERKAFASSNLDLDTKAKILLEYYDESDRDESLLPYCYELADLFVKHHPEDPKSWSIRADYFYRDGELEKAREGFRKAVEIDPGHFVIWNQILLLDSQLDDYASMLSESEEGMELFPSQPGFYLFNGIAKMRMNDYDGAIESLETGVSFVVDNDALIAQFYTSLGDSYQKTKEYEKSDKAYDQVLSLEPDNVNVLNNYAYYLSLRKAKLEQAATMSKRSNELQPGSPSFQDTYGWILYQQKKYQEAADWLKKALDSGGAGNGLILEHYGDALFQLGNKEGALENWKKAKEAGGATELIDKKITDQTIYE